MVTKRKKKSKRRVEQRNGITITLEMGEGRVQRGYVMDNLADRNGAFSLAGLISEDQIVLI